MKRHILLIAFIFMSYISNSQNLTLNELVSLCNKPNWVQVNEYLLKKGWEYSSSTKGDDTHYNTITWSFKKEYYGDKAKGWLYIYTYEGYPNKLSYSFFNKLSYNTLKSGITTLKMKLIDNSIEDNEIITKYSNSNFIVTVTTSKSVNDEEGYNDNTVTTYMIDVIKKTGVFDNENGFKKTFDTDGNIEAEFTLKDGEINGTAKSYYPNGQLKVIANFINGIKQGASKEYDEYGNITGELNYLNGEVSGYFKTFKNGKPIMTATIKNGKRNGISKEFDDNGDLLAEYNYLNDELNGQYKIYLNNKLKKIGGISNGVENGLFKFFDDEGRIEEEYNMKLGLLEGQYTKYYYGEKKTILKQTGFYADHKKNGLWKTLKYENNHIDLVDFTNYSKDVKNGLFKEVLNDSIIFGSYKNGFLDGDYKVYISLITLLTGKINGDTTNAPLIISGYYVEGAMNGFWRYYSLSKGIVKEGRFHQNEKYGEWKYYFENYVDSINKPEIYSGKLFLIENYNNGIKNGKEIRYAYLYRKKKPCDATNNLNNTSIDTCFSWEYEKILQTSYYRNGELDGLFEQFDSTGIVTLKGNYKGGKKEGFWLESYVVNNLEKGSFYTFLSGIYNDGLETGIWDENTRKDFIFNKYSYQNGKLNGPSIKYYSNKQINEERIFKQNELIELAIYDTVGKLLHKFENINVNGKKVTCVLSTMIDDMQYSQGYQFISSFDKINYNLFEMDFLISTSDTNKIERSDFYSNYFYKGWKKQGIYLVKNIKTNKIYVEGNYINHMKNGVFRFY